VQSEGRTAAHDDLPGEVVGRLAGGRDHEHLGGRPEALDEGARGAQTLLDRGG
jgi:hypothetical protein